MINPGLCSISCSISLMFLIGMIYMTYATDKSKIITPFMETLNKDQQAKYKTITKERATIYLSGFSLGFVLALAFIFFKSSLSVFSLKSLTNMQTACLVTSITFVTTYFYYILSKKSDYMVRHLETSEQKDAWLSVYKTMQFNYHFGLLLGLISVFILGFSLC